MAVKAQGLEAHCEVPGVSLYWEAGDTGGQSPQTVGNSLLLPVFILTRIPACPVVHSLPGGGSSSLSLLACVNHLVIHRGH